jgi:hypothetical protein
MPSLAEIRRALHGAWRLLLLDPRGIQEFDGSLGGALRSFWAVLIVIPLDLATIAIPTNSGGDAAPVPEHGFLLDLLPLLASWPILLLLLLGLVKWYGRGERFGLFLSAYNWTQILQALGILVFSALMAAAGAVMGNSTAATASGAQSALGGITVLLALIVYVGVAAYEWYVAWVSLDSGLALPTIVLLLDLVLGLGFGQLATALA